MGAWLADAGLAKADADRLAKDPPLTLFLMLEAEADTQGKSLGALGSVIMGETLVAGLPAEEADPALDVARAVVFRDSPPRTMAEVHPFPAAALPLRRRCPAACARGRAVGRPVRRAPGRTPRAVALAFRSWRCSRA